MLGQGDTVTMKFTIHTRKLPGSNFFEAQIKRGVGFVAAHCGVIVWHCDHGHFKRRDARECAKAKLYAMMKEAEEEAFMKSGSR